MANATRVRLVPEQPVGLAGDALGFSAYAHTLADAAHSAEQPLTIGVFGEWGTGKSSLMRMVADSLNGRPNVVTVECNAWQYQHEEQPLFPLVASVIRRFDDHRSGQTLALGAMRRHLREAMQETASGVEVSQPLTEVNAAPTDMSDRLDEFLKESRYAKAFQLLSEVEVPRGWRFVVFVDDLDRCSPERAVRLLESIKLVLDQPGFVFVLGVSQSVIEQHLEHLYREKLGITDFSGSSYLEKLVQLPFPIPSHRDRIDGLAGQLTSKIDVPELNEHLKLLASVFDFNPRALIRVVNNLVIDRSINEHLQSSGQMDEVPIGLFAISRALQHRWPSVHRLLELAPKTLTDAVAGWHDTEIPDTSTSSELSEDELLVAQTMKSSPELQNLLHSAPGLEWLRNEAARIAAAQFVRQHKRETPLSSDEGAAPVDVYISYPKKHQDVAIQLHENLASEMDVFLDTVSVEPGESSQQRLESALQTARALLFLFGASTTKSTWQRQEALAMVDRQDSDHPPAIIPVLLPGSDIDQFLKSFPSLAQFTPLDLRTEDAPYESSTQAIRRVLLKRPRKKKK